jgi:hypothetical protein
MSHLTVGPLEFEKVGDFASIAEDPSARAAAAIQQRFPKGALAAQLSPGGVWFSTVEEEVQVLEGKRKVKRARRRLHWLTGNKVVVAKDLPVFHSVDFDERAGLALLSGDRGEILALDLEQGTVSSIPLEGFELSETSCLQGVHFLTGGRALVHEVSGDGALLVAKVDQKKLTYMSSFAFEGDHTVVNGRILVGGGMALSVLDLALDQPKQLGKTEALSCWMTWHRGPKDVRLYTHDAGAWDVRGFDAVV